MKWLAILLAVGLAIYAGIAVAFPTYTHRFRLTVEVETPQGVRSGSSVVEVERKDQRWILIAQGRYVFRVRGEAVFVDLGEGRNLVALMGFGPLAENTDQMISLWVEAYGQYKWDEDVWSGRTKLRGPVELRPPLIPTLATFSDPSDPKTARIVWPDELEEVFGPGVRFKRAWLEMTGDPVTKEIEQKLPMVRIHRDWMYKLYSEPTKFAPHLYLFLRS